jgi:sRNA-binding protein
MEITIRFDNFAEAAPVLALLSGTPAGATVVATAVEAAETPQRTRRTKAEMEAERAAQAAKAAAEALPATPVPAPTPASAASTDWDEDDEPAAPLTKDDVRAELVAYQGRSTMEKAQALLKDVGGVEKLGALPPEKFQAVINAAKTAK